jgi:transcriptional regulator with XRE-family HTH domain
MAQKAEHDPAMAAVLAAFEKSGLSLHELGVRMGYPAETARMSAWQFVQKTSDPRVSMVRRFAKAMGIPIEELVADSPAKKKGRAKADSGSR